MYPSKHVPILHSHLKWERQLTELIYFALGFINNNISCDNISSCLRYIKLIMVQGDFFSRLLINI